MNLTASIRVGDFVVDSANQRLWKDGQPVDVLPQVWAVFRVLLERPNQTISKKELHTLAWRGVEVSDAALSQTIRRLRSALHDDARKPQYIETVHRRGFRLIAPLSLESPPPSRSSSFVEEGAPFVGRIRESATLTDLMRSAQSGSRRIAFVEGDPGIGKTALVGAFREPCRTAGARLVEAQCVQQHGLVEPYMPVLEALDRAVCSDPSILAVLRRYAPSWLPQIPWLLEEEETRRTDHLEPEATKARMLREMARALEVLSVDRPLVLILEDLHWADQSTIDLVSLLIKRPEPAQLMIVGTYRPIEAVTSDHPIPRIVRTLASTKSCTRLCLEGLSAPEVRSYIAERFDVEAPPLAFAEQVHSRSEGNPLFVVAIVDHLVDLDLIASSDGRWKITRPIDATDLRDIPNSLREMIGQQLAALGDDELEALQAASVAAIEFRSASVAAALAIDEPEGTHRVEAICDRLAARSQLVNATGEQCWPDGTRTATYRFDHQLYRQSLYESLGSTLRRRYHQRVAERLETAFKSERRRVVAELAAHFDKSGDRKKAASYAALAARQRRSG